MRRSNLFVFILCLILVAGCSESGGPATPVKPVAPQDIPALPEEGGTIVESMIGEPSNLIAALSSDSASHSVATQIYVSLLKYDKDINLVPYAAESYEVLNGGTLLKFKVREDIFGSMVFS